MKRNDLAEFKNLSDVAILQRIKDLKKELADLVIDKNMNKLKDVKVSSRKRKDLAQSLTILRQKQLLQEAEAKINAVAKIEEETKDEPNLEAKKAKPKTSIKKEKV